MVVRTRTAQTAVYAVRDLKITRGFVVEMKMR
jgi:hypothetical protein